MMSKLQYRLRAPFRYDLDGPARDRQSRWRDSRAKSSINLDVLVPWLNARDGFLEYRKVESDG